MKTKEATTTASLSIKPGSGRGTDVPPDDEDELLKQRKKELPKKTLKQIGEQKMSTVATYTSNSRDVIGHQYNIMDMHNKTTSDMWTLSKIEQSGNSYSFTVTSTQPDHFLTKDNLERNLVAGCTVAVRDVSGVSEAEEVAESLVNAISNGIDSDTVTESLLGINSLEVVTESEQEVLATESVRNDVLSLVRLTKEGLEEEQASAIQALLSEAVEILNGKKKED